MKQIWHIFKKDVRHYWPEIATSLLLLIPYARNEIQSWSYGLTGYVGSFFAARFLNGLVGVLVPFAFAVLIVRLVHDESLVGDRQFWVTRPYEWKELLAAKILFVLVCVDLPILILQIYLLAKAGFSAQGHAVDLFRMHLGLWVFLVLPVATLATLTASLAQFGLGIVAVVLYMFGAGYISDKVGGISFGSPADAIEGLIVLVVVISVVLLQYSRRATRCSLLILAGMGFAIVILISLEPYMGNVNKVYPPLAIGQPAPVVLALSPEKQKDVSYQEESKVQVQMPLLGSGVPGDSFVQLGDHRVTIEAQDGYVWKSKWSPHRAVLYTEITTTAIGFSMERKVFERLQAQPVKMNITFTSTVYHDEFQRKFVVPDGSFVLPEVGICSAEVEFTRSIHCLAAFRRPSSLLVTLDMSKTTCRPLGEKKEHNQENPHGLARQWESNTPNVIQPGISPVLTVDVSPWSFPGSSPFQRQGVCPGTPLVLSHPRPTKQLQFHVQLDNIRLSDYALKPTRGNFAIGLGAIAR